MTKEELLAKVQAVIDAPSCYAGLREAAKGYLEAVGTAGEKEAAEALLARLREDVQSIDEVISFFASDKARELFGPEQADAMLKQAREVKAKGGDTCFCPACTAGKEILDHGDLLRQGK